MDYNAFISYAWRDNQPFEEGGKGWVSVFVDRLGKLLDQELPRHLSRDRIWLDYEQLRGNDHISDIIRQRLGQSRLYLPILSKAWLDSPWCLDELAAFLEQPHRGERRLFPIWMGPVDGVPAPLDGLLKYKLWYEDDAGQPRTRWFPDPDPTDRDYGYVLQDLARDLAGRLREIAAEEAPHTAAAPPRPATPIRPEGEHLVLINGGDDDWALVQEVARRLDREHGIGYALPLRKEAGLKSSEINRDLRDKLSLCNNVLLVFNQGPEHQVHRHITEALKSVPRRPKSAPPLSIELCHPCGTEFGFKPPGMKIFECDGSLDECARQLAELLA